MSVIPPEVAARLENTPAGPFARLRRVDQERVQAALRSAGEALTRLVEALRNVSWDPSDEMRWTPPPEGEEVPRWLA